jgi:hypothetical protein
MAKRSLPKSRREFVSNASGRTVAATERGPKRVQMPGFIAPSLATLSDRIPVGDDRLHEPSSMDIGFN